MTAQGHEFLWHGAKIVENENIQFCYGIMRAFDPWIDPVLLGKQKYYTGHEERKPMHIEFHMRRVAIRLSISLNRFNYHMRSYGKFIAEDKMMTVEGGKFFEFQEEAGMAADSVIHYLYLFIHDLARFLPYALNDKTLITPDTDISIFGGLLSKISESQKISGEIKSYFQPLSDEQSWFKVFSKRNDGIRQLLMHWTSLLMLGSTADKQGSGMRGTAKLVNIGEQAKHPDFEQTLKDLFHEMYQWLDGLQVLLSPLLEEQVLEKGVEWRLVEQPPRTVTLKNLCDGDIDRKMYYLPDCKFGAAPDEAEPDPT